MTEHVKRKRDEERKQQTQRNQGNLGQKDAQQQMRSEAEMSRMGELTKEKNE
jgi:hypothetical protein